MNPLLLGDIIQHIFEFLTLCDQKNARLVNKVWCEVSNRRRFIRNQAFFLPNMYDYGTIVNVLSRCKNERLNLKFDQSLIDDDSLLLWESCGDRIESLNFCKCIFQNGIIPALLEHCVNLNALTIQRGQFLKDNESFHTKPAMAHFIGYVRGDLIPVAPILLPATNMVHEKLTWLHLESSILKLQSSDLERFASTFPALRCLKMKIVVNDDVSAEQNSDETPNLFVLFELLATKQKDMHSLNVEFSKTNSAGQVKLNFLMFNRNIYGRPDIDDRAAIEPYFKLSESLRPIPFLKFCSSLKINTLCKITYPNTAEPELEGHLPKLIINNPQLQKLEICVLMLRNPQETAFFFAALILSRLQYLSLKIQCCDFEYPEIVEQILELYKLPESINKSVRRLRIQSNADTFSVLCLKYFQNVEHLTVKPVNAEDVFKYQKNLKKLSIALIDKPFDPPPAVVSVESLEVLKIRGSILNFLSAYQFPRLKYLLFTYYCKEMNEDYDLETPNEPVEEGMRTLLPLFGVDFDERDEQELKSIVASSFNEHAQHAKLFLLKLNRISSVLAEKVPDLEGLSVKFLHPARQLRTKDYSLFFQLCQNFPKLRYVSVRGKNENVKETEIKSEMLKHLSQCPSLRAAWFESNDCRISLYFNIVSRKLEFSEQYSKRNVNAYFDGVNLKKFYFYKR